MLTHNSYYEIFKAQAKRLLPNEYYEPAVAVEKQLTEIQHLSDSLHYERFFFVINYHEFSVQQAHGVNKWLGYNDEIFTLKKYYSIMHPAHLVAQMTIGYELLESFMSGEWTIGFMSHRYINTLALKHANGDYLSFKKTTYPFQVDTNHRLISTLSEFTLIGPYNSEPFSSRLTNSFGEPIDWHEQLQQRSRQSFHKSVPFSKNELLLLEVHAAQPNLTTAAIAARFNVKESTIITYKKRILEKAERLLHHRFKTAKDVAVYLKEQGLL